MDGVGKTTWVIADGYLPAWSTGREPEMTSHEAFCVLNAGDRPAIVEVMVYYADRDPSGPFRVTVEGKRNRHVRFNDLVDREVLPLSADYAAVIRSNVPVVVQHTRLDSRQAENGLFSTIAYPAG
ncbi:MAG: sensory rhodopsin transducer [Dehalococcoidia bacterium]|nr:sensory rhodopsin transducer [Dehalococcoidia bacterium]